MTQNKQHLYCHNIAGNLRYVSVPIEEYDTVTMLADLEDQSEMINYVGGAVDEPIKRPVLALIKGGKKDDD